MTDFVIVIGFSKKALDKIREVVKEEIKKMHEEIDE